MKTFEVPEKKIPKKIRKNWAKLTKHMQLRQQFKSNHINVNAPAAPIFSHTYTHKPDKEKLFI